MHPAGIHMANLRAGLQALLAETTSMSQLLELAGRSGWGLYLVGGFLRDVLLGDTCEDVDLVSQNPEALAASWAARVGGHVVSFDRKFGTIRLIPAEPEREGRIRQYDLSPLRGSCIADDLGQRDFTMNSLAVDLVKWQISGETRIIDPLGGMVDLSNGILRACARHCFAADPVRILRAYRLISSYNFVLESQTRKWLLAAGRLLERPAAERLRDELALIFSAARSAAALRMLAADGLLEVLMPEGHSRPGHEQRARDAWSHGLSALEALELILAQPEVVFGRHAPQATAVLAEKLAGGRTRKTMLKLAVLAHDIGKPLGAERAAPRFSGHETIGSRLVLSLCARLRFSNKESEFAGQLVRQQLWPRHLFNQANPSERALAWFFRQGPARFWPLLLLFAADHLAGCHPEDFGREAGRLRRSFQDWLDFYYRHLLPRKQEEPLVNGRELMAHLNLGVGPLVGRILKTLAELQWEGRINSKEEALREAARLLEQWQESKK